MIYDNIAQTIGHTPIVKLSHIAGEAQIYAKLEYFNPGGSIKDRIALNMIDKMLASKELKKTDTIVEPTSGNTGIGIALIAAAKGMRAILTMPESMSIERRRILAAYGAKLVLTDASKGMKGAIEKANELSKQDGYVMLSQFENKFNPQAHEIGTAQEIMADFKSLDAFVAGVGTGGTITGVARELKKHGYGTKFIAVEPEKSPVLSGGKPSAHKIQGIGAGFIPNTTDTSVFDLIEKVSDDDAMAAARGLAKNYGLLVGISSGAAYVAARREAKRLGECKNVLFIAADNGERYLSTELYEA